MYRKDLIDIIRESVEQELGFIERWKPSKELIDALYSHSVHYKGSDIDLWDLEDIELLEVPNEFKDILTSVADDYIHFSKRLNLIQDENNSLKKEVESLRYQLNCIVQQTNNKLENFKEISPGLFKKIVYSVVELLNRNIDTQISKPISDQLNAVLNEQDERINKLKEAIASLVKTNEGIIEKLKEYITYCNKMNERLKINEQFSTMLLEHIKEDIERKIVTVKKQIENSTNIED